MSQFLSALVCQFSCLLDEDTEVEEIPKKKKSKTAEVDNESKTPKVKVLDNHPLTLKEPITTVADDSHKYFYIVFQRK